MDSVSGQTASAAGNSSVPGSGALAALSLLTKVFDISETLTSQWRLGDDDEKAAQYGAGGKGIQQHSATSASSWAVVESFCPGMRESMFGNANVAVTGVAETLTTASEEQEQQQQQQQTEGDHGDEVSV